MLMSVEQELDAARAAIQRAARRRRRVDPAGRGSGNVPRRTRGSTLEWTMLSWPASTATRPRSTGESTTVTQIQPETK
jgi:hypothetical protein